MRSVPANGQNIGWDPGLVGPADRMRRNAHRPLCVWFTGLSGSGKSTIAGRMEKDLFDAGYAVARLDGDNLRCGFNADLGFTREDRRENIYRAGYIARLLCDLGNIVLCAFISPYADDRAYVRRLFPEGDFLEVYVNCALAEAERRDPKGLYAGARSGEITALPGIDAPVEEPEQAELVLDTSETVAATNVAETDGAIRSRAPL